VKIVPLSPAHVDAVARLHGESLTGLLTALGPRAIRAYYTGAVEARSVRAYVAMDGETLAGFVLGSAHPADLRREIVRANRLGILTGLALGVAARPAALRWILANRRTSGGGGDHGQDPAAPELVYLAVSSASRGGGTGRLLVVAFTEAMKTEGVRAYELSVDDTNAGAIAFYERLGFRETGRYREFGAAHRRYRLELA
jgi:ribosomal protein S18 acetylase RimI-like enzyme